MDPQSTIPLAQREGATKPLCGQADDLVKERAVVGIVGERWVAG